MSQLTLPEFSQGRWLLLASTLCRQSPYWTWKCWGKGSVSWKKKSWELLKLLAPGGSPTRTAPEMLQYSPCWKSGCEGPECFNSPKIMLRSAQKWCVHISLALPPAQISWPCEIPLSPQTLCISSRIRAITAAPGARHPGSGLSSSWAAVRQSFISTAWTSFGFDKFTCCEEHDSMNLKNVDRQKEKHDTGYFFNLEKHLVVLEG